MRQRKRKGSRHTKTSIIKIKKGPLLLSGGVDGGWPLAGATEGRWAGASPGGPHPFQEGATQTPGHRKGVWEMTKTKCFLRNEKPEIYRRIYFEILQSWGRFLAQFASTNEWKLRFPREGRQLSSPQKGIFPGPKLKRGLRHLRKEPGKRRVQTPKRFSMGTKRREL